MWRWISNLSLFCMCAPVPHKGNSLPIEWQSMLPTKRRREKEHAQKNYLRGMWKSHLDKQANKCVLRLRKKQSLNKHPFDKDLPLILESPKHLQDSNNPRRISMVSLRNSALSSSLYNFCACRKITSIVSQYLFIDVALCLLQRHTT